MSETAANKGTGSNPAVYDKPRLTFWQIWNVSFGFLGVQFGFALQNANASRILIWEQIFIPYLSFGWWRLLWACWFSLLLERQVIRPGQDWAGGRRSS